MNKKLMAVAIAGVFAAPAVALAQNSTVQIYGTFGVEYGFYKGDKSAGVSYHSTDAVKSGASNFGIKGSEKLGGGLSAYFQCESDVAFLNGSGGTGSLCGRNSALGIQGGFGKVYYGTWDSPLKQAVGLTRLLNDTGPLGVTHTLLSIGRKTNDTVTSTLILGGVATAVTTSITPMATFSDRPGNSFNYDSPVFSGFQVNLQTTAKNGALKTVSTATGVEGRANSFNLLYSGGPIKAAIAHTVRDDNMAAGGDANDKDKATTFGLAYSLGKAVIGLTHADMESKLGGGVTTLERKVWNLAVTYDLPGPHSVWAGYTKNGKISTNGVSNDSGSNQFQIGYKNTLSKRTFAAIGYGRVSNDSAGTDSIGGHLEPSGGGRSSSVVSLQLSHKF